MNNLATQINTLYSKLNDNQKQFWDSCAGLYNKIEQRTLSEASFIKLDNDSLRLVLQHNTDGDTQIDVKVDKYEVYITCAGMGASMLMVFPKARGRDLYDKISGYMQKCLEGAYIKRIYYDSKGREVKAELLWDNNAYETTSYIGLFDAIKMKLFPKNLNFREYRYSSFIM